MIQLIRSKRRTISLIIKDDGDLLVRAPNHTRIEYVQRFLQEKEDWIKKHQNTIKDFLKRKKSHKFITSQGIYLLGKRVIPKKINLKKYSEIKSWYKAEAEKYITKRLDFFADKFDLKYGTLKITDAKRRWGSCSGRNNMNFSWRILMAPKKTVDYVIIHELAHIKHKNHSARFWDFVETMMKDYKKHDNWLEENRFLLDF
jgi:predicted metal-dependent hydrolase